MYTRHREKEREKDAEKGSERTARKRIRRGDRTAVGAESSRETWEVIHIHEGMKRGRERARSGEMGVRE